MNVLWIYGDSQARRLIRSLGYHPLCRKVFSKCDHTYTWTYKHFSPNSHDDRLLYTGADFNESKLLNDIKQDILREELRTPKSVFLVNFGIHIIMSVQLEKGYELFQNFLKMLHELRDEYGLENLPLIIWKSTTLPVIENALSWKVTHTRFLTKQVGF